MKNKILKLIAGWSYRHPWIVIWSFILLGIIAIFPASNLKISPSWKDLLPQDSPSVKEYNRIIEEYSSATTIYVVFDGSEEKTIAAANELVDSLKNDSLIRKIDYRIPGDFFMKNGLLLEKTKNLENSKVIFTDANLLRLIENLNNSLEKTYVYSQDEEILSSREKRDNAIRTLEGIKQFLATLEEYQKNRNPPEKLIQETADKFLIGDDYYLSYDRKMLLIIVYPNFLATNASKCMEITHRIRRIGNDIIENSDSLKMGLTGIVPLSSDEYDSIMGPMTILTFISLILVIILFIIFFRLWASSLFAGLVIVEAVILTAGIASITYGYLNIMTAMFGVILIGLLIDFSIHIISNFQERMHKGEKLNDAIEETLLKVGGGIFTGGATTAIAFAALAVSSNRGMREFGVIVGIGLFLGMLSTLFLLPSILVLYYRNRESSFKIGSAWNKLGNFGVTLSRKSLMILILLILISSLLFFQGRKIKFDYDMLNIEPTGMESVVYHKKIMEKFDLTPDNALLTSDNIEEIRKRVEEAKKFGIIAMVKSITNYLPSEERQVKNKKIIKNVRKKFKQKRRIKKYGEKEINQFIAELDTLWMNIVEISVLSFQKGQSRVEDKCYELVENPGDSLSKDYLKNLTGKLRDNPDRAEKSINKLQNDMYPEMHERFEKLLHPEYLTISKIPKSIKSKFISKDSTEYLTTLFADSYLWNLKKLRIFNRIVKKIDPEITGDPVIFLRIIKMIKKDGKIALIVASLLIFVLLLIDFKNPFIAGATMVPLVIAIIWLFAIMELLGLKLNVVNIMALPLILGIGIDDGVHFVHRYLSEGKNIFKSYSSTGKAAFLTTVTTSACFGILSFQPHRGMASMGIMLFIGISLCWITTVLFLAPVLRFFRQEEQD